MPSFRLSPKAVSDMQNIWDYTLETWDKDQAKSYVRLLNQSFADLAENPHLGPSCEYVREGYRKHLAGRHVLYYRIVDAGVFVIRILHSSMDVDRHL